MQNKLRSRLLVLLLCASFLLITTPSEAQSVPGEGQAIGVLAVIVGIGVGIGVGTYYLIRKAPSITGCTASSQNGMELQNESDQQNYRLIGDLDLIKPGERVRVSGKKKKDAAKNHQFLIEKLSKNFGPCKVQPTIS